MNLKDGLLTQGKYKGRAVSDAPTPYLLWLLKQTRGIAHAVQDAAAVEYARRLSGQKNMTLEAAHVFIKDADAPAEPPPAADLFPSGPVTVH